MNSSNAAIPLGFLTCTEFEGWGLCGGLLLLNHLARPLEFHCTLPVKVSRTQAILFGASLRAYICGQVIGKALLEKSKTRPGILLTDCPDTAALHAESDIPLALVSTHNNREVSPPNSAIWESMELRQTTIHLTFANDGDQDPAKQRTRQVLQHFAEKFDLDEPFERVRQAITEARDAAQRAA
jgi:hypothetical protein